MKKLLSVLLVIAVLISNMGMVAFADTELNLSDRAFSVMKLSKDSFLMSSGSETGIITVEETITGTMVTVESQENNEIGGYFYHDKTNDTIYSSYTGKTVSVSEIISNEGDMTTQAVGDVIARKTHKISYAKLVDLVTPTSGQLSIATAFITIVAASQGVTITTAAVVVMALISTSMWDTIRNGILIYFYRKNCKIALLTSLAILPV